jgi:hypothetical protein
LFAPIPLVEATILTELPKIIIAITYEVRFYGGFPGSFFAIDE